jgi:hypothetical protein
MLMTNRTFPTTQFGEATIAPNKYHNGGLAIQLFCPMENAPQMLEPLARLSLWLPNTPKLPENCFFVKTYSENGLIIKDVAKSGWFAPRVDLTLKYGDMVWELLNEKGEGFLYMEME